MKLSIVVPVYNVEQYLTRCLESIVTEMCDDYELILVDDGSTDASGSLCDSFAHQHPLLNIIVLHQPNGGLSAARNRGVDVARGTYITFIDSDDYIDPYTITENMAYLLAHPEVDMLEYPIEVHAGSSEAYMLTFPDETQRSDIFADWIRREGYAHCYACNKIYAASLWKEIRFPINMCFEDGAVMPDVVRQCKCIHYSSRGCYRYIANSNTITTNYRYVKSRQLFTNNHRLYREIKEDDSLRLEAMSLWSCCLNQLIDMGRCFDVDREDYKRIMMEVEAARPAYSTLLGTMLRKPKGLKPFKLLPLPIVGLAVYLRLYLLLASSLK